jgi:VWFA-related protein
LERRAEPPSEKEMPRGTKGTPQDNSGNQISPSNLVVYLFDDVHLKFGDLGQVRDAAARQMDTLQPTEQAAILATSGLVQLPFTSDKTRLHQALLQLRAQPLGGPSGDHCPDVSYYQADQMLNVYPLDLASNPPLQAAYADVIACMNGDSSAGKFAQTMAINAARVAEQTGKRESRGVLLAIRDVIHWLSQKPGRKTVILVSPGFILSADLLLEEGDVIDQAIRAGVNISTLDARGLYTGLPAIDRNYRSGTSSVFRIKTGLELEEATASAGVLRDLAEGTGGTQVRDTNDLYGGLQSLATPPEYTYMLGFKPEASKLDGSFHPLQVKLNTRANLYPQARRGYYAANQ